MKIAKTKILVHDRSQGNRIQNISDGDRLKNNVSETVFHWVFLGFVDIP